MPFLWKKPFNIDDININKILSFKKESYCKKNSFKPFFGYSSNNDIRPLCIKIPEMIGYAKYFDSNKTKSFKANDNKLFKKYTLIWGKVISLMNIKFDSEPVHGDR